MRKEKRCHLSFLGSSQVSKLFLHFIITNDIYFIKYGNDAEKPLCYGGAIMKKLFVSITILFWFAIFPCCNNKTDVPDIVVNSLEDLENPPTGTVTLRSALAAADNGQPIVFDPGLDGGTIELAIVGDTNSILEGEIMGMEETETGPVSYLVGYFDRDYGKSALYARKDVVIDASDLPSGITLSWVGTDESPDARVLAVYGDLTLINVSVTGGRSVAEETAHTVSYGSENFQQLFTLARGGGVAVWGVAWLMDCRLYNNYCEGDFESSRDRGAYGGGLYGNIVHLEDCVISGNSIYGGGAAGGGVFSFTGADTSETTSTITRTAITGNRITALFTYGGGVYSDGGGIGNGKTLQMTNTTVAWNVVDAPSFPPSLSFLLDMGYWRGGGLYMSNGYLDLQNCTIVENEVLGRLRTDDLGKRNMAGGIAATIGNAHAVEHMSIGQCIIAANTYYDLATDTSYDQDIFTGSLLYYKSKGYNRIGVIDFSQILVPVGEEDWASLCRRHFPKTGDETGVDTADVLNMAEAVYSDAIGSVGVWEGAPVVLYYPPAGSALDRVPPAAYATDETFAEYAVEDGRTNNFLEIILDRVASHYDLADFAASFTEDFEIFLNTIDIDDETEGIQPYTDPDGNPILSLADTQWFGPAVTWPKELSNYPYIEFWHRFDTALAAENIPGIGPELLGDDAWLALFETGPLVENTDIFMSVWTESGGTVSMLANDQLGTSRPTNDFGDIGAIEVP